ncbi:hypothetical protein PoB_003462400 [Plakobranchus ocellatus]|uniref:Uncharacterized protein n=1 Tax=Plakobranchus ocellatus TaxID=259542 RepID=A0AAV4AK59_9GAST|nr:hypothetical protein PoB_003462400 [Plakobranchus ocellatus]
MCPNDVKLISPSVRGVGGTAASESALKSAETILSLVRALPSALWPDEGPESLRSSCCGLAIDKNQTSPSVRNAKRGSHAKGYNKAQDLRLLQGLYVMLKLLILRYGSCGSFAIKPRN